MSNSDKVILLAQENKGTVTTAMLNSTGIARQYLKNLVDAGALEKVARGIYVLPGVWDDEFFNLQSQFRKGIFSKETALFLHDLTDRTPPVYSMTFPENYNLTRVKSAGILASRSKEPFFSLGVDFVSSPLGYKVKSTNMEKTLCDLLRPKSGVEAGVAAEAFKRYVTKANRNIPRLSEYAKFLKVEEKVRSYLEVLI